ncbi:MAG: BON domain-containing protein [Dehalococcoidia bacterium]
MLASAHDRQLEDAICTTLAGAGLLDEECLRVHVSGGVAYIDGRVGNYQAKKDVSRLAGSAAGLRKVINRLRVVPGAVVQDEALGERVRHAIQGLSLLSGQPISVCCKEGRIELSGTVDRPSLRLRIEDVVWSVPGVGQVLNKLQVSYSRDPEEREIGQRLEELLQHCLGVAPWQISVEVDKGIAYLRGKVSSQPALQLAEEVVRWHPHIRDVVNHLIAQEASASDRQLSVS